MKKSVLLIVVIAIVAAVFSSCKTHERCPAYGKNSPQTQQKSA